MTKRAGWPPSKGLAQRRSDGFLAAQRDALELVVKETPLTDVLAFLTGVVERHSDGDAVASIFLLDEHNCLRLGAAPSLPVAYLQALEGLKADATLGTCSAAAATGRTVVTSSIATDPAWLPLRHLPLGLGLIAAWSQPIVGGDGRVLGTFGTYFRDCREPSAAERRIVEILSHTAALAIERAMSDAAFRDIDRRKDEFLAVLSHELRNPLAPLRTGLQLLGVSAHDPVAVARLQGRMVRQVDQLIRLVDDLLESSRISRGELRLQMERVDAGTIIRTAIEAADALVQTAGLRLTMQIPANPVWVHGDIVRLAQIVANLLNNAVKYSEAGGEVTVGARQLGANVEIFVRDTGVGIAPEHLERIFEMFTRGVDAGVRAPQGLGIGLALARRLAELHGGRLTATSAGPGRGSEFTLVLKAPVADT